MIEIPVVPATHGPPRPEQLGVALGGKERRQAAVPAESVGEHDPLQIPEQHPLHEPIGAGLEQGVLGVHLQEETGAHAGHQAPYQGSGQFLPQRPGRGEAVGPVEGIQAAHQQGRLGRIVAVPGIEGESRQHTGSGQQPEQRPDVVGHESEELGHDLEAIAQRVGGHCPGQRIAQQHAFLDLVPGEAAIARDPRQGDGKVQLDHERLAGGNRSVEETTRFRPREDSNL